MEKQTTKKRNENVEITDLGLDTLVEVPVEAKDVVQLNIEKALASYPENERQEIIELSEQIDVKKTENIMNYGSNVLMTTFEQCGNFLKSESGTTADQEVIKKVIELSEKAGESYDDFNLVIKEPSFLQKIILKMSPGARKGRTEKIKESAVTNYKLLVELKKSCESWIEMLVEAMGNIGYAGISDVEQITLLEKYILAGNLAEKRIKEEMTELQEKYQETGLQKYEQEYQEVKEGYDIFQITMANLEKSRVMYKLSIGQLALIRQSNRNVQISIRTQATNSMALLSQQLRNAVLNAKNKEVLEAQKSVTHLNNELIKEVSETVGMTAEDTEKGLYSTFYNTQAAKQAIESVVNSCAAIEKVASDMLPKMKADVTEITNIMEELKPAVMRVEVKGTALNEKPTPNSEGTNKELKF